MLELFWFCLAAYGLTQIIVYSKIFEPIRPKFGWWGDLFHCPMCIGFWVGTFLFGVNYNTELFTFEYSLGNMFCLSCLGAGTTYILSMIVDDFGLRVSSRSGGDYVDD